MSDVEAGRELLRIIEAGLADKEKVTITVAGWDAPRTVTSVGKRGGSLLVLTEGAKSEYIALSSIHSVQVVRPETAKVGTHQVDIPGMARR